MPLIYTYTTGCASFFAFSSEIEKKKMEKLMPGSVYRQRNPQNTPPIIGHINSIVDFPYSG